MAQQVGADGHVVAQTPTHGDGDGLTDAPSGARAVLKPVNVIES